MGHARELELSAHVKFLSVKAIKKSSGRRAIKAAIVETEPDLFHFGVRFVRPSHGLKCEKEQSQPRCTPAP